jgi:3-hydroxyisobutyrate dehydrogenase
MARNAAAAGLEVHAWNRSPGKAAPLAEEGVTVAETPAEAVEGVAIVVTMLSDAEAVIAVAEEGAFDHAAPGTVWAQMSTIGLAGTERCQAIAREHRLEFVDAPVLGTKQPAEEGKLAVLASGPREAVERCAPLLDAVGSKMVRLGEAGEGTRLKLVLNNWIVALVGATAETTALAEVLGLDPKLFLDTIAGGPLDLPYAQLKGKSMIERKFPPSFKLSLALKDANLVRDAAAEAGLDLRVAEASRRLFEHAVELGHGDEDLAAAYRGAALRAPEPEQ